MRKILTPIFFGTERSDACKVVLKNVRQRHAGIVEVGRTSTTDIVESEHSNLEDDPLLDW